jgi:hypothetical protein
VLKLAAVIKWINAAYKINATLRTMNRNFLDSIEPMYAFILFGFIIFFLAAFLIYKYIKNDARLAAKIFKKHAQEVAKDVVLFDGVDSYLFADYLLLIKNQIWVIKCDQSEGYIYGAENIHEWTCVKNYVTNKMANPLEKMNHFVMQIKQACGIDAVQACILFGSQASFPKGVPTNVLQINTLEKSLMALPNNDIAQQDMRKAWEKLMALVEKDKQEVQI